MSEPRQIVGSYQLFEPLGRGGMGVVFRAVHLETGQPAALKLAARRHGDDEANTPLPGVVESLRREIRALSRIRHPGIVRILDEGRITRFPQAPWHIRKTAESAESAENTENQSSLRTQA